MLNVIN
jgi:hypothetical protein